MLQHVGIGTAALAFVAGLLSFFSPCVAPLVPGYIGYLSGAARAEVTPDSDAVPTVAGARRSLTPATLLFVGGFSAAFVALGLASASVGRLVAAYRPVLETVAGVIMLAMGAFLLGLLPRGLTVVLLGERRLHLRPSAMRGLRAAGPFALGVVFAAGWTPCIGPVLAAILAYVGASADRTAGVALLAAYAAGFALPFLAVGLGWSAGLRALGWVKRYGRGITLASGVALIAVGVLYLAGEAQLFASWAQNLGLVGPQLP
jgi:cytochrome c-type biogenesis protein